MAAPYRRVRLDHAVPDPVKPAAAASWITTGSLVASDLLAVCCATAISVWGWNPVRGTLEPAVYAALWPLQAVFVVAYAASGLYPGIVLNPVEEFRRIWVSSSLVYAILGSTTFLLHESTLYSRGVFLLTWAQTLVFVPLFRSWMRAALARRRWWGYPVIVLGSRGGAESVIQALLSRPHLGLKPFAALLDGTPARRTAMHGVPVAGPIGLAPLLARQLRVRCAIVAMPELATRKALETLARRGGPFYRLIIIPEITGLASLWVAPADISGMLGLEIRQSLFLPRARFSKRAIDLSLALTFGALCLPLCAMIAVAVKLTSRGTVLYGHRRSGRDGRPFTMWKFRTMVRNADEVLMGHLVASPALRREWEQNRKLRHDPRVTCIGRFLRKTSLDELPQLWNVLRNQMSLVGPRPLPPDEIHRYGEDFALYKKVTPGITGLWQVSGRSQTAYQERVKFDLYYVSNWSVWLDLHILARTVATVLLARGAY